MSGGHRCTVSIGRVKITRTGRTAVEAHNNARAAAMALIAQKATDSGPPAVDRAVQDYLRLSAQYEAMGDRLDAMWRKFTPEQIAAANAAAIPATPTHEGDEDAGREEDTAPADAGADDPARTPGAAPAT